MAGVIPPIFASQYNSVPWYNCSWFGQGEGPVADVYKLCYNVDSGSTFVSMVLAAAISSSAFSIQRWCLTHVKQQITLKKSGAFIPGIRPGEQTSKYIDKVMTRLTLAGALYITFICLVPEFMTNGMANAILLRRYINFDYRCCYHGLYGTSTDSSDDSSV